MGSIKKPVSLDLDSTALKVHRKPRPILESPDLKMFSLTTPEVEKFIMSMNTDFIAPTAKEELKTESTSIVPSASIQTSTNSDQSKIEKKRERNRLAASKCRLRKIEKIQFLESKKKKLNEEKDELQKQTEQLKSMVDILNQELLMHISAGCTKNLPNIKECLKSEVIGK